MDGLNGKTKTEKPWTSFTENDFFATQLPIIQNYQNQNLDLKEVDAYVA